MKKTRLRVFACMMAMVVLFVSIGWDVNFHYCTIDHELTGSFGDASSACEHCVGHHHDHHEAIPSASTSPIAQFNAKCCCDDFEQTIGFTDNYVFSSEKSIDTQFLPYSLVHFKLQNLIPQLQQVFQHFTVRKIPNFNSCRNMLIFYSSLKINPLVF